MQKRVTLSYFFTVVVGNITSLSNYYREEKLRI